MVAYSPGIWNPTTRVFDTNELALSTGPDVVRLYYQAGIERAVGCPMEMDNAWARAVTYLSLSLLERPICDCTNDTWEYWREDLAGGSESTNKYAIRALDIPNPFGSRRGAIQAWQRVKDPHQSYVHTGSLT